jgi:hypothetical protein
MDHINSGIASVSKEEREATPGRKITNYKLQITNYKLQITNYKLQITNYKLQITNYKLQITNYIIPTKKQFPFQVQKVINR